jgi:glycerophosphoryl diester phosphodiesterase
MTGIEAPKEWDGDYFKKQRNSGITGFEIQADKLPVAFVTDAHAHGMPVYAFTVNEVPTMLSLIEMGVDGIETDVPRVMIRVVKDMSRR